MYGKFQERRHGVPLALQLVFNLIIPGVNKQFTE